MGRNDIEITLPLKLRQSTLNVLIQRWDCIDINYWAGLVFPIYKCRSCLSAHNSSVTLTRSAGTAQMGSQGSHNEGISYPRLRRRCEVWVCFAWPWRDCSVSHRSHCWISSLWERIQPSHLLSCFFHTCVLVVAPCTLSVSYFRRQTKEVTVRLKPFKLGNFKREPQAKHGFCCRPSNKRYCSHRAVMADPWHIWGHAENWWCFIPVLLERQSKGTPENRLEISSGKSIVKRVSRGVKNKVANEYQVFLM